MAEERWGCSYRKNRGYLSPGGGHLDGHHLTPLTFGDDCIGLGQTLPVSPQSLVGWWICHLGGQFSPKYRCSCGAAVSVGMSEVLVPTLSFGEGTAFCLLALGPQGFISSFQPQTRGCVKERSEERSQYSASERTK